MFLLQLGYAIPISVRVVKYSTVMAFTSWALLASGLLIQVFSRFLIEIDWIETDEESTTPHQKKNSRGNS